MNEEFSDYVSRYLTGFVLLKDHLEEISIKPLITEAYGRTYCRLYIDVSIKEKEYPVEIHRFFRKHFYNVPNTSGNQFVSVEVKNSNHSDNSLQILKQFYNYYVSVTEIFRKSLPSLLNTDTRITITDINTLYVFQYVEDFFREFRIGNTEYKNQCGRTLEQDIRLHPILKERAKLFETYAEIKDGWVTDTFIASLVALLSLPLRILIIILH